MTTIYPDEEAVLARIEQGGSIYFFTHPDHREDLDLPTLRALVRLVALGYVSTTLGAIGTDKERQSFSLTVGGRTHLERMSA